MDQDQDVCCKRPTNCINAACVNCLYPDHKVLEEVSQFPIGWRQDNEEPTPEPTAQTSPPALAFMRVNEEGKKVFLVYDPALAKTLKNFKDQGMNFGDFDFFDASVPDPDDDSKGNDFLSCYSNPSNNILFKLPPGFEGDESFLLPDEVPNDFLFGIKPWSGEIEDSFITNPTGSNSNLAFKTPLETVFAEGLILPVHRLGQETPWYKIRCKKSRRVPLPKIKPHNVHNKKKRR